MEVWYGPHQLCTLDLGCGKHLSWAYGVWLVTRMLADEVLHIARMLAADNALQIARTLPSGAWSPY